MDDKNDLKKEQVSDYKLQKSYDKMVREKRQASIETGGIVLKFIIGFLLILVIISALRGQLRLPSFTSLLSGLSDFDVIPSIPFIDFTTTVLGDWGAFNFLRDFIQFFVSIANVLVFLFNGLISVANFVVYFFRWIFL